MALSFTEAREFNSSTGKLSPWLYIRWILSGYAPENKNSYAYVRQLHQFYIDKVKRLQRTALDRAKVELELLQEAEVERAAKLTEIAKEKRVFKHKVKAIEPREFDIEVVLKDGPRVVATYETFGAYVSKLRRLGLITPIINIRKLQEIARDEKIRGLEQKKGFPRVYYVLVAGLGDSPMWGDPLKYYNLQAKEGFRRELGSMLDFRPRKGLIGR